MQISYVMSLIKYDEKYISANLYQKYLILFRKVLTLRFY